MPGALAWAYDTDNNEWVKVKTDSQGRLYTVAVIDELDDIGDVHVPAPTDGYILYWNDGNSRWECKAAPIAAHKDTHDPEDGADKLDCAAPVKVAAANAEGNAHSFARSNHVHEREHARYTDVEAVAAAKTVKLDDFTAPDDNTDLDAAAGQHGLMPKNDKTKLDGATNAATASKLVIRDASARAKFAAPGAAGDALIKGTALTITEMPANVPIASITFIIDGGGSVITTGIKGALEIPFACIINRVTLLADQSGSIVVNIWKQAYADYPPEVGQKITASAPPTISGALMSQDSTLTGWTTAIAAGDCLMFNVDSITTCTWVTLSLKVTKT